jgi:3-deoxy-D-manno-octulosonic-acid transferase
MKKLYRGHQGLLKRIEYDMQTDLSPKVWFHAASLGEFEQGRPVMEAYKKSHPNVKIVLTFFSSSGYEKVKKNYDVADYIYYLPFDTNSNARKFVRFINPVFAVFIIYEFWHNYIYYLHKTHIPLYSISGIFRANQIFFKSYGGFFRRTLRYFTHFFVQNEASKELLKTIGIENVTVTGDTRFDRVMQIVSPSPKIDIAEKFSKNSRCIVAGSTWNQDEVIMAKYINENNDVKLIIAPHEIKPENINRIKKLFNKKVITFSEVKENTELNDYDVLLIDNIGMLSSLYQYGQIAYIGGGFGVGIHNTLEAAVYGIPVLFGTNYKKFAEAINLIHLGAAFSIDSEMGLAKKMNSLWKNTEMLKKSGAAAKEYVTHKSGATKTILEMLNASY